jgi:hypothetical protein
MRKLHIYFPKTENDFLRFLSDSVHAVADWEEYFGSAWLHIPST